MCSLPIASFSKWTFRSTGSVVLLPRPPSASPLFTTMTGVGSGTVAHFPPSMPHCPFRFDPQANVLVSRTVISPPTPSPLRPFRVPLDDATMAAEWRPPAAISTTSPPALWGRRRSMIRGSGQEVSSGPWPSWPKWPAPQLITTPPPDDAPVLSIAA